MEHMKGRSKEERPEAGKSINVLRKLQSRSFEVGGKWWGGKWWVVSGKW